MKKTINESHIEGILYEHDLELRTTGPNSKTPGTQYIRGSISVATDNAMLNIVPVYYNYVVEKTNAGKVNNNFTVLNNIINGVYKTAMGSGADKAAKVRVDSAIGLNEFYTTNREGNEEFVSVKRNDGGFIHVIDVVDSEEKNRNTFKVDMVITGVTHVEADEEKNTPEKAIVKGAIFDFRKALLPVDFTATNANAIDYFMNLGASSKEPVFTCIWGRQISETIVKRTTTKSAFGDDQVKETKSVRKDFIITGAAEDIYPWDDEQYLTANELLKAKQDREIELANMKARSDEYKASKAAKAAPTPMPATSTGSTFDF